MNIEKNHNILDFSHGYSELEQLLEHYTCEEAVPAIIKLAEFSNDPLVAYTVLNDKQDIIVKTHAILPYSKYIIRHNIKNPFILSKLSENTEQLIVTKLRMIKEKKEHDRLNKKHNKKKPTSDLALYNIENHKHSRKVKKLIESAKKNPISDNSSIEDTLVQAFTLLNQAESLYRLGKHDQAAHTILDAISTLPTSADLWCAMARYLQALGNDDGAYEALFEALTYVPEHIETLEQLLSIAIKTERLLVAERYISRLPDNRASFLCLKGDVLRARYDYASAVHFYQLAYKINKKNIKALKGLSYCFFALAQHNQCLKYYKELIGLDFQHLNNLTLLSFSLESAMYCLDWRFISLVLPHLEELVEKVSHIGGMNLSFCILAITDSPELQKNVAQKTAALLYHDSKRNKLSPIVNECRHGSDRIRIAYLSADIGDHIVTWLLSSYIKLLDKEKFEVYIYSYNQKLTPDVESVVAEQCDHLYRIENISDKKAAELIRIHNIDILVDLTVYTSMTRSNIMGYRPAAVQIAQMGYPSSSGATGIYDYINTDKNKTKKLDSSNFTESYLKLPEMAGITPYHYKPKDRTSRTDNHLPENAFIYACFNQSYKITQAVFLLWCEILNRVSNSILWLYVRNEEAKEQILSTAKQQGIDASRFVFAPYVNMETHLKRLPCADLVLDTMPYGNHSTGAFTLMCEVPMMAYRGKTYVASVSASFMECIGAPEMIVENEQDYVTLAVRFAADKAFRQSIQAKVEAAANDPAPLFDAERFVAHYQKGLEMVWENYLAGHEPRDIEVPLLFEPYGQ